MGHTNLSEDIFDTVTARAKTMPMLALWSALSTILDARYGQACDGPVVVASVQSSFVRASRVMIGSGRLELLSVSSWIS
jgi:hypothetical protein